MKSYWDHSGKPSVFVVKDGEKEIYRGPFEGGYEILNRSKPCIHISELPSRRYACIACGRKGRRSNAPSERLREPVCPRCEDAMGHFDIYAHLIPFWQKQKEKSSPEFKRMLEASDYYDRLVKGIKEK